MLTLACGMFMLGIHATSTAETAATNPEQRALGFVEVLNNGSLQDYEAFTQKHRAQTALALSDASQRAESLRQLREMFGDFKVLGVEQDSPLQLRVLAEPDQIDEPQEIIFTFVAEEEYKINTINFEPLRLLVEIDAQWENLQSLLDDYVGKTGVPSWAAAVVKDGKIVDSAVAGMTGIENAQPVDLKTGRYHWGSVSKSVTGTVIGALVEMGKLHWETTIADIFTDDAIKPAYRNVTITQLMDHRGGIPAYTDFTEEMVKRLTDSSPNSPHQQRENWVLDVLRNESPIAKPGSTMVYSNAGVAIAGVMAERASNQTWEQLVQQHVFAKADMQHAGFGWPASAAVSRQPRGHVGSSAEQLQQVAENDMSDLLALTAPAGNINSTIGDFARYALMHLNGLKGMDGKLKAATIQHLHTPSTESRNGVEPYSFGWGHARTPDGQLMHWHNGGAGTFYAEIRLIPESNLGIVILANAGFAERAIEPLWQAIYKRFKDTKAPG